MALRRASLRCINHVSNLSKLRNTRHALQLSSRTYASALPSNENSSGQYVSPFQEIFDTIQEGKTFLGSSEFNIPEIKHLKCGIPEHVLRFKTTAYDRLLEEPFVRPNEHKVTLRVDTRHIALDEVETMVLKEIVGTRLNEESGVLQLSSNQFGSRIENKRHVVSMLERIVDSTKTLAARIQQEVAGNTV
eukprot:CAMPEP_0117012388 /NCGR_PEP_ID=MMETSP0472-20121206/10434_1 /TAXON_ID=693140 ORGANISM="Tiarina fusus, Strain LIS" /NCGR_SAMPLE_ID=MMETSP0472 /ASSEMBLY_ACC=CAM_ASM_000603 /LENGTH=189 /DNA_ID=CAMNT_0004715439 /DNA_START=208 /DNA_END=777 /DNA_ORIENTATION=+